MSCQFWKGEDAVSIEILRCATNRQGLVFFSQQDKKGAIVDERYNGGGSAADYIVDVLQRDFDGYFNNVAGDRYPFTSPSAGIWGPKVMIINEMAGSGGDLMPYMFKRRKIGMLAHSKEVHFSPRRSLAMRNRLLRCVSTLTVCALLQVPGVFGQSKQPPRKKIKDFGSSLQRLKWNPIKKETVETKPTITKSASDEDDVIRFETSLVAWDVLVIDKEGNNVRGLTGADFAVKEDGFPQEVGHFLLGDNQTVPRTIVLIIDYSGSQLPYLRNSIDAAKVLVDQLASLDRMAIVTDDVELILDFTDDKSKLKKKLESLIDRTRGGGGFLGFGGERRIGRSKQYSALMATLNEAFNEEDKRPIIVFQTDGDEVYRLRDPVIKPSVPSELPAELRASWLEGAQARMNYFQMNQTEFSLADLYRTAEKSRATIYTIFPGYQLIGRKPEDQVKLMKLDFERRFDDYLRSFPVAEWARLNLEARRPWGALSDEVIKFKTHESYIVQLALAGVAGRTGGWTEFLEKPSQAASIYARIFSDINQRYIIGYYPTNKERDGKRRRIDVAVKDHPEYTVLGRRSYYAPAQ